MATIAGLCFIKIDGRSYDAPGDFNVTIGGPVLTAIPMANGTIYNSIEIKPGKISGTISTTIGLSVVQLKNARNITVQVQAANGSSYILKNAFFTGEGEVNVKEGSFAIEFQGNEIIQL